MQLIFGTDGIRGIYDKEITYLLAYKVGYAVGVISPNNNPIVIGRDTRISGEIILKAISRGIKSIQIPKKKFTELDRFYVFNKNYNDINLKSFPRNFIE